MAKIIETTIPEAAVGTVPLKAVCQRVLPIPYAASLNDLGTE